MPSLCWANLNLSLLTVKNEAGSDKKASEKKQKSDLKFERMERRKKWTFKKQISFNYCRVRINFHAHTEMFETRVNPESGKETIGQDDYQN